MTNNQEKKEEDMAVIVIILVIISLWIKHRHSNSVVRTTVPDSASQSNNKKIGLLESSHGN